MYTVYIYSYNWRSHHEYHSRSRPTLLFYFTQPLGYCSCRESIQSATWIIKKKKLYIFLKSGISPLAQQVSSRIVSLGFSAHGRTPIAHTVRDCVGFITKRLSAHSCVITTAEMGLPVFFFFNESRSLNLDKNYVSYKNARTKEKEREEMLVCFIGGVGLHAFARSVNAVPNMAPRLVHHITAPNRRRSYIYFKTSFYMLSTYKNRRVFPFLLGFSFSGIYFFLIATGWRPGWNPHHVHRMTVHSSLG